MFGRVDQRHMKFFNDHSVVLAGGSSCGACGQQFLRPSDLFKHLANKSQSDTMEALSHRSFFEAIALPFVERDTGLVPAPGQMLNHLRLMLSNDFVDSSDDDDDDDDDDSDDGFDMSTFAFMIQHTLAQAAASQRHRMRGASGARSRARGRGMARGRGSGRGRGMGRGQSSGMELVPRGVDVDSDSDDGGMFGMSADDVNELLCQGIKPWDDCAWAALAALHGDSDDFYF